VGEHMLTLAAELRASFTITFVCPPSPAGLVFLKRAARLGLAVLPLAAPYHERAAVGELERWLAANPCDIFHVHAGIGWEGFGGVEAARAAGIRAIVRTEHLPYLLTHPTQQLDHRRIVGNVDRLICVSEAARQSFAASGLPASRLRVVHNGISTLPLYGDRRAVRAELALADDAPLVLTVGRLVEQKGHRYLLAAIPSILAQVPAAQFLWVGEGPLRGVLQAESATLGLNVHLLGRRDDVPRLLAAADLFVLPSLFEGLPLVVLEAMAAGLPIVGTNVSGTSEVVRDGVSGRLVPAADAPALAAAISGLLTNPALARRMGAAGRDWGRSHFSAARMAAETAAIYRELLTYNTPYYVTNAAEV